jgi:hypothetical protein
MVSRFRVLSPAGLCAVPLCSLRPAERILEVLLRTLAVVPVIVAWPAQDLEFFASGPAPARHQAKDGEGPGRCLAHRGLPGKTGCPRTRAPLLAEERVI